MPDELTQDEKFKLRKILYHVYDEELRADRDTEIACLHEDIAKLRQQLAAKDAEIERLKWQWAEDSVDIDKALTAAGGMVFDGHGHRGAETVIEELGQRIVQLEAENVRLRRALESIQRNYTKDCFAHQVAALVLEAKATEEKP